MSGDPENIAGHRSQLDIGVLQDFLHPILFSRGLLDEFPAITAEVFAQYITAQAVTQQDGLEPLDDPEAAKRLISETKKPIIIVGHLPHLSRLASLLIVGNTEQEVVRFRMGGIVCLTRGNGNWLVDWVISPELFL